VTPSELWALDTFRSIDPVYIHNFVIGYVVARKTRDHLTREYGQDFGQWGACLRRNHLADGRRRTLKEKTAMIGSFM
jgi:hypothetical protein